MDPVTPRLNLEPDRNPDSPRERTLRKQLHDVQTRLAVQRNHYEDTLEKMREAHAKRERHGPELDAARKTIHQLNAEVSDMKAAASRDMTERQMLESRLAAGAERRKDAILCLNALLTCEDDKLSDEAYDKRMDTVIKHARRIVTAERAAILKERGGK